MNSNSLPAISIVATPTKRSAILQLAQEAESRGFAGLACPSLGATLGLCTSLAHATNTIRFWTSIQPVYYNHPVEMSNTAAHIHEISGGRFGIGLGVSHAPVVQRLGVATGKPLTDMSNYVASIRANSRFSGELPPIYLAALRDKMLALSVDVAEGAIWANASLSDISRQVDLVPPNRRANFFMANMIPTVISDDEDAAMAIHRKTLTGYMSLPNYRNYWRQAGYAEEMDAAEVILETLPKEEHAQALQTAMSDRWLRDCTASGSATSVRDQLSAWTDKGILPIAVMSSTSGGQAKAIAELFNAYS
jgi:alkanesulfonate monooxygenase SsuD/methylene tetrahydromethanopterin reductase-like flavin-dependent oxidoreductase (luciferase family)